MIIEWAKDNDQDVYIEGLPSGLTLSVFVATANLQTATPVTAGLTVTPTYGTYDIPATYDVDGKEVTPARTGVTCYKAPFEGDQITSYGVVDTKLYLLVKEAQNIRRYAELYIREASAAVPATA